jgi:molecular chaperone GrpE
VVADEKATDDKSEVLSPSEEAEDLREGEVVEPTDELEELRESLHKAEAQAAEYLDGWQRSQAAFSNYKKRQDAERSQMMALAGAGLMMKLLPIGDDFDRAIATLPGCLDHLTWVDGFFLIKHKLDAVLQSEGVTPIETEGREFDPLYHEAITYEVAEGFAEGQIIGEVQRGHMLGERVLRPALVRVAKAPPPPAAVEESAADATEAEASEAGAPEVLGRESEETEGGEALG